MAKARMPSDAKGAVIVAAFLTAIGLAVGGVGVGVPVVILVYLLLAFAMSRLPLRYSLFTLMFMGLTLENPAEGFACNEWQSPIYPVGALMLNHMNTYSGIKPLFFSGMDLAIGTLLVIGYSRRSRKRGLDHDRGEVPRPLRKLALVSLATTATVLFFGMARGGVFGMALWQMDRVVYLPVLVILFSWGLRGPQDLRTLARLVLAACLLRAVAAILISHFIRMDEIGPPHWTDRLAFATTHHDSILFAVGVALLAAMVVERVDKRALRRLLLLGPVVALGIWSNGRRMAWVQVALNFGALYFLTPENRIKHILRRVVIYSVPVAIVYVAVGWNVRHSKVFKPVQILRSVVDAKSDGSTLWRDIENYDLVMTFRQHPLTGAGYGHPFDEVIPLPEVAYSLEYFVPHNSVLALWAFAGPAGYTGMTLLWAMGVFFAMRSYYRTKDPQMRAAALVCSMTVLTYMIQCWGDMGLGTWTGVYLMAPALAMAGNLAVATGAWPSERKRTVVTRRAPVAQVAE